MPSGNQASLRVANRARIVDAVKRYGGLTQVELAGATGLSPATVSNIVKELAGTGVLHTAPSTHSGRRAQRVTLAHGLGLVVGVHVSSRHLRVSLADVRQTVVAEHHMPLARDHRADLELDKAALMIADMLETLDAGQDELRAAGVAVSAPVDRRTGAVARRGIMRGWDGIDIAATMARRLNKPVYVDNAANLAALAESRSGAARGTSDSITLELGDGIGVGIIVGGRTLHGHHGVAGEFGHTVIQPQGPLCRCGNRGCLEAVAGGPAVLDALGDRPGPLKLADLIIRAMSGDAACIRAIADAGRLIGGATAGLCNVLDPERVVVTGEFARAGELLLGPMRHAMEAALLIEPSGAPDLVQGQLQMNAAVLGAVALAIESVALTETARGLTIPSRSDALAFKG